MKKLLLIMFVLILLSSFASAIFQVEDDFDRGNNLVLGKSSDGNITWIETGTTSCFEINTNAMTQQGSSTCTGGDALANLNLSSGNNIYSFNNKGLNFTFDITAFGYRTAVQFIDTNHSGYESELYTSNGIKGTAFGFGTFYGGVEVRNFSDTTSTLQEDWDGTGTGIHKISINETGYKIYKDDVEILTGDVQHSITEGYIRIVHLGVGSEGTLINDDVSIVWKEFTPSPTATPIIELPSPENNNINTTNVTLNVSSPSTQNDLTYYLYFGTSPTLTEGDLYLEDVTRNASEWRSFYTNVSDGIYYWKWKIRNTTDSVFSFNTTQRTWQLDSTSPTITINPRNSFNSSHTSGVNQYGDLIFYNITISDSTDLYGFVLNITRDGISYFNFTNVSLTGHTEYTFTNGSNTSNWGAGVFNVTLQASDSHTSFAIDSYNPKNGINTITFNTPEGNEIKISSDGSAWRTLYNKKSDRYEFGWDYLFTDSTRKFTIESPSQITYIPNSKYLGHFIVGGINGNWIDFEGLGSKDYSVKRVNDYKYEITFINLPLSNTLVSKSIGGINLVTRNYKLYLGNYSATSPIATSYGKTEVFILNLSRNTSYVSLNASLLYNNIVYDVTTTYNDDYIQFARSLIIPRPSGQSETISFEWDINVTQQDDSQYNFTVSNSLNVSQSLLDNCSHYNITTLNVTFADFDTDNLIEVNFKYSFDYSNNNYSNSGTRSNFSLCLFDNTSITGNLFIEYRNGSNLYTYYSDDLVLTNTLQIITLRISQGTTDITATVYDQINNLFEGVYIKYLKWDVDTNNYELMGTAKTNTEGSTLLPLVQNTEKYKFMLYYPFDTLRQTTVPSYITETTLLFQISTGEDVATDFHRTMDIDTRLTFSNVTNRFTWTYSDTNNLITRACLDSYRINAGGFNHSIDHDCLTTTSGVINSNVPKENGTTYCANGKVTLNAEDWFIDSLCYTYPSKDSNPAQFMGLLIAFIMTIAFAFAFKYSIELGVIAIPLPLLFCCIMGIVDIATPIVVGIEIAAIVLAIILNKVND